MANRLRISIFLPTHNYGRFLAAALQSILDQTYPHYEILLIDNASTDNTRAIVDAFVPKFEGRLIYFFNPQNAGAEPSINQYLSTATGEIVAFMAADDLWIKNKLELQIAEFEKDCDLGLVYSNYYKITDLDTSHNEALAYSVPMPSGDLLLPLLKGNFIGAVTVATRKTCLLSTGGFDEKYDVIGDYVMWIKIAKDFSGKYIDVPLAKIRYHGKNLSYLRAAKLRRQRMLFLLPYILRLPQARLPLRKKLIPFFEILRRGGKQLFRV